MSGSMLQHRLLRDLVQMPHELAKYSDHNKLHLSSDYNQRS